MLKTVKNITLSDSNIKQLYSFIARVISLFVQLFVVRELTTLTGTEGYGIYIYFFTIIGISVQLDFGLSLYIQNYMSKILALNKYKNVFYKYFIGNLIIIFGILIIISFFIQVLLLYFNVYGELKFHSFVFLVLIFAFYPTSIILSKVVFAKGNGHYTYYYQAILTIFFYIFLKIINLSNSDFNIIDLTLFYYTLSSILNVIIFIKKGWDEKFTPKYYKISLFKLWLFKARKFWIFGLIGLPITQLDSIILGSFSDYDSLAYYSIVNKYFLAACYTWVTVMIALNHPIITHSWEKKEFLDIEIILKKVLFSALIVFFVATSLFEFYYSEIIDLFLHEKISSSELNWRYIFYFSFLLKILSDVYLMFFIATSKMQIINKITLVQAILSFILQLILYKLFGLTGLITAIVITYAFSLLFLSFNYYKIIRIAT